MADNSLAGLATSYTAGGQTTNPFNISNNYGTTSTTSSNTNPFSTGLQLTGPNGLGYNLYIDQLLGTGFGQDIQNFINSGAGYNQNVLQALINQIQPQVNTGIANLEASAGATGTRFGSGYEVGLGDYLSQVNANENTMAAGLYEQSVQNQMSLLSQLIPGVEATAANQGGILSDIASFFTGGVSGLFNELDSTDHAGQNTNTGTNTSANAFQQLLSMLNNSNSTSTGTLSTSDLSNLYSLNTTSNAGISTLGLDTSTDSSLASDWEAALF